MADNNQTRRMETTGGSGSLPVPDGSLQPGQVLQNRYRILGVIGVGGMGAVYQARDQRFEDVARLCAVKEMINMAQDQQTREQSIKNFKREAELLATLSHPAIPQIFDFFSFGDRSYLVMEYIQGKDLEAILNSTSQYLPTDQIIQWAIEICDVLAYLHNHKPEPIVFRDMKPSNVMIDHHRRVRLIDFGIAKTMQVGQQGTTIGTEGYSPPEQYKGEASPAADIYALGASLHHLLTRRDPRLEPPFSFEQNPVRSINSNISEELDAIVMRALAYDPKDRYSTADAMKQSLESLLHGNSIAVQSPSGQMMPGGGLGAAMPEAGVAPASGVSTAMSGGAILPLWTFKVEDAVRSKPLVQGDTVYVTSYDNNLWALDIESGELRWKFATEGGIGSSPTYSGGQIYVSSSDSRLYAVDPSRGSLLWSYKTEGRIYSTPRADTGLVFVGSDDGFLYALRPGSASVRELWKYQVMSPVRSTPLVHNDNVFVGTDAGDVLCLDLSGEIRWRFQTRRRVLSSPIEHENLIYMGSDDWHIYAIEPDYGSPIWRYRTRGQVVSTPAIADGKLYVGSADGNIYALDAMTGKEVWKYEGENPVTSSPVYSRETIYIGVSNGMVLSLHAVTGELMWQFRARGPVLSSPTVVNDVVFIGSDDKHIYALPA